MLPYYAILINASKVYMWTIIITLVAISWLFSYNLHMSLGPSPTFCLSLFFALSLSLSRFPLCLFVTFCQVLPLPFPLSHYFDMSLYVIVYLSVSFSLARSAALCSSLSYSIFLLSFLIYVFLLIKLSLSISSVSLPLLHSLSFRSSLYISLVDRFLPSRHLYALALALSKAYQNSQLPTIL